MRTYDVVALTGPRASGVAALGGDYLRDGGQGCTGIVKLAQWFAAELLTPAGSVGYAPDRGTSIVYQIASGILRTESDVFAAFGFAVGEIQATANAIETSDMPDDERFANAALVGIALQAGCVKLTVELSSRAGTQRLLILPVTTVPA